MRELLPVLGGFIERELDRLQGEPVVGPGELADWELLNDLFRRALMVAWQQTE